MLRRVTPHLQHALEVNRLLDGRRLDSLTRPADDAWGTAAVVVVGMGGHVLYSNPTAARLMTDGDPIGQGPLGHLRMSAPAGRFLPQALDALAKGLDGTERHFHLRQNKGETWEVRTLGFDPRHLGFSPFGLALGLKDRCLLIALRKMQRADGIEDRLIRTLGFTPAEARIAVGLSEGHDLSALAEQYGRSIHTLRNQEKSALWKAGVRRQADLVGLVERIRRG